MKIGTKSLLFGSHQFLIHPFFVFLAWCKLFGFPKDWRLWICFLVHDWGYWGKPNIDGKEGKSHPLSGAKIAKKLFGKEYENFCLGHSSDYVKHHGISSSKLYHADKMAFVFEPRWLYLSRAWLSGELYEYRDMSKEWCSLSLSNSQWFKKLRSILLFRSIRKLRREKNILCLKESS